MMVGIELKINCRITFNTFFFLSPAIVHDSNVSDMDYLKSRMMKDDDDDDEKSDKSEENEDNDDDDEESKNKSSAAGIDNARLYIRNLPFTTIESGIDC
jgi:hypothetical protein